ncbi:CST complex subunit STN1-like [Henckelia pumila]|uniref:CST complex subunit STN1-like n=1 Tax=Henckelia pumila TaxID=405737 RepID=UPI003C6E1F69
MDVKLLALYFLALTPCPTGLSRRGMPVLHVESLGIVVTREHKPGKFLKFTIDDGTGCIPCVLWLNQLVSPYFSRRDPSAVRFNADMAAKLASQIHLGAVARVRGKVKAYRGTLQITVSHVVLEADPNAQVLHWLDCVRLGRNCYDKFPNNRDKGKKSC